MVQGTREAGDGNVGGGLGREGTHEGEGELLKERLLNFIMVFVEQFRSRCRL